jgi:cobalt-zinc-cadmium efflux system outer membrane protein
LSKKLWKQLKGFRPLLSARIKGGTLAAMELTRFSLELEQQRQLLLQTLSQASRLESQLKRWLRLSAGQRLTAFSRLPTPAVRVSPSFANPHPLLAYWKSVISSNQAKTRLQQALAWKDLSLSVAYLNQSTQGVIEHGFVVGVSLPLPLFQRNQTGIRRAVLKTRLSRMQLQQTRWRLKKLLRFRFQQLQQTQKRLQQFEQRMSPRLPGLLRSAKVLFQGKGSLTTLLNVIRALSQYQKTGLRLRYQISLQALALQEVSGHALP